MIKFNLCHYLSLNLKFQDLKLITNNLVNNLLKVI